MLASAYNQSLSLFASFSITAKLLAKLYNLRVYWS